MSENPQYRVTTAAVDPVTAILGSIIEDVIDSNVIGPSFHYFMEAYFLSVDSDEFKNMMRHCTTKLCLRSKNSAVWRHLRAFCNSKLGYHDRVVEECEDILKSDPSMPNVADLLSYSLLKLGESDIKLCPPPSIPWHMPKIGEEENDPRFVTEDRRMKAQRTKDSGNIFFRDGNYTEAFTSYSRALQLNPYDSVILSNRAISAFKLTLFGQSWADATNALKQDPINVKALHYVVYSSIGMNQYKNTIRLLEQLAELGEDQLSLDMYNVVIELQKLIEACQKQHETGEGYEDVYCEKTNRIGEYTGPVEVAFIPGKNRGLIATKKINPGQLILASKAIAFLPINDKDLDDGNIPCKLALEILKFAEFQMQQLLPLIYHLWAGKRLKFRDVHTEEVEWMSKLDLGRIMDVCEKNAFLITQEPRFPSWATEAKESKSTPLDKSLKSHWIYGLWHMPSYINHCCWGGNAHWTSFQDIMFVRALREIEPGEEITMNTYNTDTTRFPNPEIQRRFKLMHEIHGDCCPMCELEERESQSIKSQRLLLLSKFKDEYERISVAQTMELFHKFEKLREGKNAHLNIPLLTVIHHVVRKLSTGTGKNRAKQIPWLFKVLLRGYELTIGTPYTGVALRMIANLRTLGRQAPQLMCRVFNKSKKTLILEMEQKFQHAHVLMYGTKTVFHSFYSESNEDLWA